MSPETPLQLDMFSGKLVDTRSTTQKAQARTQSLPQQQFLFSQRDLAQYVNPNPHMPFYPYERLELVSEDPRTPEEIERDWQKAIEAQTHPLFTEHPEYYNQVPHAEPSLFDETAASSVANDDLVETNAADVSIQKQASAKLTVYLELVRLCEEDAETLWIDPHYAGAYLAQIALTALKAHTVGLTPEEIQSALCIGRYTGSERKRRFGTMIEVPLPKPENAQNPSPVTMPAGTVFFSEEHCGAILTKSVF